MDSLLRNSCTGVAFAVMLTLLAGPAAAMTSCRTMLNAAGPDRVEMAAQKALERVSVREMYGADQFIARTVSSRRGLRTGLLRAKTVERRVEGLWRRRIPARIDPADLVVSIDVVAVAGITSKKFESVTGSKPPFILLPTTPIALCNNATHKVVEGGAVVQLVFGDQALPGQYNVEIEARVELP